ncbi:MAG: hypothetical protein VW810_00285 [Pelagibacteraceae bacterium]
MAETTTISRPAPYLEAAGEKYLDLATQLAAQPIDTTKFAPTVAGQNVLTQQAQQAAATQAGLGTLTFDPTTGAVSGVGTGTGVAGYQPFLTQAAAYSGPQAYQQFMSPYQQEVIDASLAEFDKQRAIAQQQIAQSAITSGAFGGGREGVQQAEFGAQSLQDRALLEAQLRQQGFQNAQQAAAVAQQQQVGLASLQPSLSAANIQQLGAAGTTDLAYQQAVLDAAAQGAQMSAFEPYQRMQFLGSAIGGLLSGYPQPYMQATQAPAQTTSPLSQALSGAATVYGLGSLFK